MQCYYYIFLTRISLGSAVRMRLRQRQQLRQIMRAPAATCAGRAIATLTSGDVAWLDGFSAEVVYASKAGEEFLPIDNLYANEVEVPGLRPGFKYSFSFNLKNGSYVRSFQKVGLTIYLNRLDANADL